MYRVVLAGILAGILVAEPGFAQQSLLSDTERARVEAELAELDARWAALQAVEARRAAEAEARVRDAQLRQVSESLGPIEIAGEAVLVEAGLPAVRTGLGRFEMVTGDLSFLAPLRIELYRPGQLGFVNANGDQPDNLRRVAIDEEGNGIDLVGLVREHLLRTLPDPLEQWSQGWGWDSRFNADVGFQTLLESTHPDAVRCLQGNDLAACASFLFLDYDGSDHSSVVALERWYPREFTAAGGQELLDNVAARLRGCRITHARADLAGDWYSACLEQLVTVQGGIFEYIPSEGPARGSILAFALNAAEPGALERVGELPVDATVGEQLETLSGKPLRQLVAEWRESITLSGGIFADGRPGSGRGPLTLLWAGGLALIALRTTRWRLG